MRFAEPIGTRSLRLPLSYSRLGINPKKYSKPMTNGGFERKSNFEKQPHCIWFQRSCKSEDFRFPCRRFSYKRAGPLSVDCSSLSLHSSDIPQKHCLKQVAQKCPDARRPKARGVRRTPVRRSDAGRGQRRRWASFSNLPQVAQKCPDARRPKARGVRRTPCTPQRRGTRATPQMGVFQQPARVRSDRAE